MSSFTVADDSLRGEQFLLLTHLICADQQIHSAELKALHHLRTEVGQQTIQEMEKILAQDEQQLSIKAIATKIPKDQQKETIKRILDMAYVDGFFAPSEKEMIKQIAQMWHWSPKEIEQVFQETEDRVPQYTSTNNDSSTQLSWKARLFKSQKLSPLSQFVINWTKQNLPETVGITIEKLEREILLSGPEYEIAIQKCAKVANEDYQWAEAELKNTEKALYELENSLQVLLQESQKNTVNNQKSGSAKEVTQQLESSQQILADKILQEVEKIQDSLKAKQRTLRHFSISLMGKTKAGKSTFHAILTQEGWEAIGVGKQRTTRLNRVYEWKNIRIIDTPGIGAPDGKSDEEIAHSIVDESDVICYVVTNDSIQDTEFQFMKLLKEKTKPLIILLNIKYNLQDSRRLEHFLSNPEKLFAEDGKSGLRGHIERIRRYAKEHYGNDYFDIIPVMLLAAQLSSDPQYQKRKEKLFQASHLQDFLDSIRESIIKYGKIRRSQTLLGSTVGAIETPYQWLMEQAQIYDYLSNTLKDKKEKLVKEIKKSKADASKFLEQQIESIFLEASNLVFSFAENNWNVDEKLMNDEWKKQLHSIDFENRINNSFQKALQKFEQQVQEALEEIGRELNIIAQLNSGSFSLNEQDSWDIKYWMRIGGSIMGLAGGLLAIFFPPLGFIGLVGVAVGLVSNFFKSKEQKRREAVKKISNSLSNQLKAQKEELEKQAKISFDQHIQAVSTSIEDYFNQLVQGLEEFAKQLEITRNHLSNSIDKLNRAYAKRIIDWCLEQDKPLTEPEINQVIVQVNRDFGKTIKIYTSSELAIQRTQEEIQQVLQEDVSIQSINREFKNDSN
jgi:uncharacterized tellurite resistance protein B-like protein